MVNDISGNMYICFSLNVIPSKLVTSYNFNFFINSVLIESRSSATLFLNRMVSVLSTHNVLFEDSMTSYSKNGSIHMGGDCMPKRL